MKTCKSFFIALFFAFVFISECFSENWVLGAMEFKFIQPKNRGESSVQAAKALPELILERISSGEIRALPETEVLDRKLKELQTERLSLFLQLSKESQARDALVLSNPDLKKLKKAVKAQEEKISDIEKKIHENLDNVEKEIAQSEEKIKKEKNLPAKTEKKEGLPFPFFNRTEENKIIEENVVIYNSDTKALFAPSESSIEQGFESWSFEKEVLAKKINGLLSGKITSYGDYCSVTVDLRTYPGAKIAGSVTDVGMLSDLIPLANRIAQNISSKIANALPVLIEFDIEPEDAAQNAVITIDGIVHNSRASKDGDGKSYVSTLQDAGVHRVVIEASGWETQSLVYTFSGQNVFTVKAKLFKKIENKVNIRLKKYKDGLFYAGGIEGSAISPENQFASITVNGKAVLGVFKAPEPSEKKQNENGSSNIAFFKINENTAFDGAWLVVNAKPYDRAANIDKRRRWMYTAYSALICSLPVTFYTIGNFTAENNAYSQTDSRASYDDVKKWQTRSYISLGITGALGAWTVIELVRYLYAADKVLPVKAKIDKNYEKFANFQENYDLKNDKIKSVEENEAELNDENSEIKIEQNEIFIQNDEKIADDEIKTVEQ